MMVCLCDSFKLGYEINDDVLTFLFFIVPKKGENRYITENNSVCFEMCNEGEAYMQKNTLYLSYITQFYGKWEGEFITI
jgi:hypothetical protein